MQGGLGKRFRFFCLYLEYIFLKWYTMKFLVFLHYFVIPFVIFLLLVYQTHFLGLVLVWWRQSKQLPYLYKINSLSFGYVGIQIYWASHWERERCQIFYLIPSNAKSICFTPTLNVLNLNWQGYLRVAPRGG